MSNAIEAELRERRDKAALEQALAELGARPGKNSTCKNSRTPFYLVSVACDPRDEKQKTCDVCEGVPFGNQVHEL